MKTRQQEEGLTPPGFRHSQSGPRPTEVHRAQRDLGMHKHSALKLMTWGRGGITSEGWNRVPTVSITSLYLPLTIALHFQTVPNAYVHCANTWPHRQMREGQLIPEELSAKSMFSKIRLVKDRQLGQVHRPSHAEQPLHLGTWTLPGSPT